MAPVPATKDPDFVLDLSTIPKRKPMRINGQFFEMRDAIELSPEDNFYALSHVGRLGELILEIGAPKDRSRLEAKRLEAEHISHRIATMAIVDVPPEIVSGMSLMQRAAVCNVFLELPALPSTQLEAMLSTVRKMQDLPTGASSSENSSASTAATRSGGTKRSRSSSSART